MLEYQLHHTKIQPENSLPLTWPVLIHPIQYFRESHGGVTREIFALGNPALWWTFLALIPMALLTIARRPTWQDAVSFGGYAAMYLPWLAIPRSQFLFYMLPAIPFMCVAVVAVLRRLRPDAGRIVGSAIAGVSVLAAIAFAPVWLGLPESASWLEQLRSLPFWRP